MYIKKGDKVIIIAGKDKGKKGAVTKAIPTEGKVVLEGLNLRKKHLKARKAGQKGQIVDFPVPIDVSNVMLMDSNGKRTRVGFQVVKGKKVRIAKTTGKEV